MSGRISVAKKSQDSEGVVDGLCLWVLTLRDHVVLAPRPQSITHSVIFAEYHPLPPNILTRTCIRGLSSRTMQATQY